MRKRAILKALLWMLAYQGITVLSVIIYLVFHPMFFIQHLKGIADISHEDFTMQCYVLIAVLLIGIIIVSDKKKLHLCMKPMKFMKKGEVIRMITLGINLNLTVSFLMMLYPSTLMKEYQVHISTYKMAHFLLSFFVLGILVPISEEFLFRFKLCEILKPFSTKWKIFISAFFFGLMHSNMIQSTYTFLFGLIFAREYLKTKNLSKNCLIHISINASSVIISSLQLTRQFCMIILALSVSVNLFLSWKSKKGERSIENANTSKINFL